MEKHNPSSVARLPHRYITGLNESGKSIMIGSPALSFHHQGGITYSRLYGVDSIPPNLHANGDINQYLSEDVDQHITSFANSAVTVSGGVNVIQAELGPAAVFPWHRTLSVDVVTVLGGDIELEVEEANEQGYHKVLLREGDSVVQRGTVHRWVNPSHKRSAHFVVTAISTELLSDKAQSGGEDRDPLVIP